MPQRELLHRSDQREGSQAILPRPTRQQRALPRHAQRILHLQRTIGNRATAALLQREEEEGSATVVGSASAEELAADDPSFTKKVTDERGTDETPTEAELTDALEKQAGEGHTVNFDTQHPSIAQMGIRPKEIRGEKLAIYVGNKQYPNLPPEYRTLTGAKLDADRMKGTMESVGYETLSHDEDKNAQEIDSLFGGATRQAGSGDALLLYYAGHGVPEGLVGADAELKSAGGEQAEGQEGESGGRGLVLSTQPASEDLQLTDVEKYTQVMSDLETGVSRGVHTTLIADACHSGAATDLVRDKAVERLPETGNKKITAVAEQIKRLEDMKDQLPSGGTGSAEGSRGFKLERVEPVASPTEQYWDEIVHPELEKVAEYLQEAGLGISVPAKPSDYSPAGITQQINLVINQLIDLGELLAKEAEESTLQKAAG